MNNAHDAHDDHNALNTRKAEGPDGPEIPAEVASIDALLSRAADADAASARPGLEARLLDASRTALLASDGLAAAAALRDEHARLLDAAPADLEVITFERSRHELAVPAARPIGGARRGGSLRTIWRLAAAVGVVGAAGLIMLTQRWSTPPRPDGGPSISTIEPEDAELAALDTLERLEDAFSGDQLDALMAEAVGLERTLQGGLIDDEAVEKGAL